MKLDLILISCIKIISVNHRCKWKHKTIKLVKKNSQYEGLGKDFLEDTKGTIHEGKFDKLDFIKTKKLPWIYKYKMNKISYTPMFKKWMWKLMKQGKFLS